MNIKNNKSFARFGVSSLAILTMITMATPSFAQNADTKTQEEKPAQTNGKSDVVVTGKKPTNKIDRQTYDLTNDIAAQTGSAADALNKVPAVTVDADGNVALRGNTNVQVLINGKQNAIMKGENRGAAILSMSGGDIESVEVMNNPGAAFSSEGSGGIINLVMKKNRRPGKFLTITSTAGENGRYNFSSTGSYTSGKISLTGGLSYRKDSRLVESNSITTYKTTRSSGIYNTLQSGEVLGRRESWQGNIGLDYNITDNDTIGTQISYMWQDATPLAKREYKGYGLTNNLISNYGLITDRDDLIKSKSASLNWEHKFKTPSRNLKTDLRYSNDDSNSNYSDKFSFTLPSSRNYIGQITQKANRENYTLSLDYTTPVGEDTLTSGWQTIIDDAKIDNTGVIIENGITTPDNNKINKFDYNQSVNAAYFTYQKQLNPKWGAQAGIRVESTEVNTNNPISGIYSSTRYTNVNPSAFATYFLTEKSKLRFSYSRRLQRPRANDLNPTPQYSGAESVRIGNPDLRPMTTDAFEIGYEWAKGQESLTMRGFYRLNDNIITSYSNILTGNIIQTQSINAGQSKAGGVEINASKKFFDKLTISLNSTISYTQLDALYGNKDKIGGTSIGGRMMLDYAITPKDKLQFMMGARGKEYTPQGYTTAQSMSMMSYSHQINPAIYFVANMTNPFDLEKVKTVVETDTLKSFSYRNTEPRVFYVGFRMIMGAKPKTLKTDPNMLPMLPQGRPMGGGPMGPGGPMM